MADIETNIGINIDTSSALASIKALQSQISAFHQSLRTSGSAANAAISDNMSKNLINSINSTKQFSASLTNVKSTADSFTQSLEKNKLSMGQYFKYGMASTKSFGRMFQNEFSTIDKVARERVKTIQTQYIKMGRDANGAIEAIKVRPLSLDMGNLGTQMQMAGQKQQIFNQLLKQGSTNLLNFGKNTQWAGRQLMVGFTLPLSIMAVTAGKAFMEMEEAVIKFRRVYGELSTTALETDKMVTSIQKLASEFTKYGIAVKDTMDLAAEAAAMGQMGAGLTAQVVEATRLAVLGGVEQSEALKTSISLTNAFGISTEELASKIDFLNAVENQTVTAIEDLTIAIPKAGPVVKQLGGSVEDLAYFLTAMREGGINASEGANALKSGLASLINPTKQSSDMLASFGINVRGLVESNAGDLKGTVIGFAQALDTLDPLKRAQAIEQLFGKFQFSRISTLFQNVIAEGTQAERVLNLSRTTAAELAILSERELKRVEDSPAYKFQRSLEDIKASLVPLGQEFIKLITPIIEFANGLLKQFNNMDAGVKQFVIGAIAVLGLIAPVALMTFGLLANGVANLIKGFGVVRSVMLSLSGASSGVSMQLGYMTQEQLEAAAVAGSLGQTHAQLAQIFTSEAGALYNLVGAYQAANAAASSYNISSSAGRAVGRTTGLVDPKGNPLKLAKGILTVPGPKGAGDVVPAMLSPGEAVVPAKQTQKYGALIQGIISDSIPGYAVGNADGLNLPSADFTSKVLARPDKRGRLSGPATEQRLGPERFTEIATTLGNAGATADQTVKILRDVISLMEKNGKSYEELLGNVKTSIAEAETAQSGKIKSGAAVQDSFREKSGYQKPAAPEKVFGHVGTGAKVSSSEARAMVDSGAFNADSRSLQNLQKMESSGQSGELKSAYGISMDPKVNNQLANRGASRGDLLATLDETGVEKFRTAMDLSGQSFDKVRASLDAYDQELRRVVAEDSAGVVFDSDAQSSEYQARTGSAAGSMETYDRTARARQVEAGNVQGVAALDYAASVPVELSTAGSRAGNRKKGSTAVPELAAARSKEVQGSLLTMGADDGTDYEAGLKSTLGDGQSDPIKIATPQRNSPHPDAFENGREDGKAYSDGLKSGKNLPPGSTPPQAKKEIKAGIGGMFSEMASNVKTQGIKKGKELAEKAITPFAKHLAKGSGNILESQYQKENISYDSDTGITTNTATGEVVDTGTTVPDTQPLAYDKDGKVITNPDGTPMTGQAYKKLEKQSKAQKRVSRAGKLAGIAGMVAMGSGMASGMNGPMGDVASKIVPIASGLAMLGPILLSLAPPIAILVGVVGLVAAGLFAMNSSVKKLKASSKELTDQFGSSAKTIQKIAEASGNVTGSEIMSKNRQADSSIFPIIEGKRSFGSSFLEGEFGGGMLKNTPGLISSLGQKGAESRILQQVSDAVLSGALSVPQARSIVEELAVQLENRSLGVNLQAKISELFGPNGENLTTDGAIEVRIKAAAGVVENVQESLDSALLAGSIFNNSFERDLAGAAISSFESIPFLGDLLSGPLSSSKEAIEDYWTSISFAASDATSAVSNYQGSLDQLDVVYDGLIAKAKSDNNLELVDELEGKRLSQRTSLLEAQADALDRIGKSFSDVALNADGNLSFYASDILSSIDDSILSRYESGSKEYTGMKKALSNLAKVTFGDMAEDATVEFQIKALVDSGELSETGLNNLLMGDFASETIKSTISLIGRIGSGKTGQAIDIMGLFVNKDGSADLNQRANFIAQLNAEVNPNEYLDMFLEMSRFGYVLNVDAIFDTVLEDPKKTEAIIAQFAEIDKLEDGKKIKVSYIQEILTLGDETMAALIADQEYFEALPPVQQKLYVRGLVTMEVAGKDAIQEYTQWAANKMQSSGLASSLGGITPSDLGFDFSAFMSDRMKLLTQIESAFAQDPNPGPGGDGGGNDQDPFENMLNRLKQVRDAAINAAGGVDELKRVLSGTKNIEIFKGFDQKLVSAGYGREFIEYINGLDAETRKTFVSINDGVVKVTSAGKAMAKAFSEVSLGDFQLSLRQGLSDVNMQFKAITKLRAGGMSLADAFEVAQDAQLAFSIATATSSKEVQQLIKDFDVLEKKSLELQLSTPEGRTSYLKEQFSKIQGYFSSQENAIQLQFTADNQGTLDAIKLAQQEIAKDQVVLDDYQYGLSLISEEESKINEKYDERQEALDSVYESNQALVEQSRAQLDVADALASGDLAAAAKAQREERKIRAERAKDAQSAGLDRAREAELNSLKITFKVWDEETGKQIEKTLTKKEIESEIEALTKNIAEIEQSRIQPNQRLLELAEDARDIQISNLEYLGKNASAWSLIESGIDAAITKTDAYKKALIDAFNAVDGVSLTTDKDGNASVTFDADKILNDDTTAAVTPPTTSAKDPAPVPAKVVPSKTKSYIVKSGDTLSGIAKSMYGDSSKWKKIYDANKSIIGSNPNKIYTGQKYSIPLSSGGMVPKYFAAGGFARGTDTVPAMLTPGEFVMRKYAVDNFGVDKMKAVNSGTYSGESVYNYSVNVNVKSDANPDQIARSVMTQIKQIDSQRIRSNRF
jgi:TP901 family phage tail tape measure protein